MWLRTRVMPRWLTFFSYLLALALLVLINVSEWIYVVLTWMLIVSVTMLLWHLQNSPEEQAKPSGTLFKSKATPHATFWPRRYVSLGVSN